VSHGPEAGCYLLAPSCPARRQFQLVQVPCTEFARGCLTLGFSAPRFGVPLGSRSPSTRSTGGRLVQPLNEPSRFAGRHTGRSGPAIGI